MKTHSPVTSIFLWYKSVHWEWGSSHFGGLCPSDISATKSSIPLHFHWLLHNSIWLPSDLLADCSLLDLNNTKMWFLNNRLRIWIKITWYSDSWWNCAIQLMSWFCVIYVHEQNRNSILTKNDLQSGDYRKVWWTMTYI